MKYIKPILLIVFICPLLCNCKRDKQQAGDSDPMVEELSSKTEVEGITLKKGEFSKELSANGKISAQAKVQVTTKLNEAVTKLLVQNGQWVKQGDLIAILDTFELYHSYNREKARYEKAQLDFADMLLGQGYKMDHLENIPKDQLKNARMRSGITMSKTDLELAKDKFQQAIVKAPISGQIANLEVSQGNKPDKGVICSIINNNQLYVDFYILEEESSIVSKGLKLEVSPFYNDRVKQAGYITGINPTVENGLIKVRAELKGQNNALYDGITVKVFVKSDPRICLAVPKEAIVLRTGKKVIFTYNREEQTAIWNYVQTGDENSTHVEILDGLKNGDIVIVSGNLHLGHDVPCNLKLIDK